MKSFNHSNFSAHRRLVIQGTSLMVLAPSVFAAKTAMPISTAINRSARFRGNAQRCAKAYCQLHLKVMPDFSQELLSNVQRQIGSGFEALGTAELTNETLPLLNALRADNSALMAALAVPPSRSSVIQVNLQADKMFVSANRLVEALRALSKQTTAQLINQSALIRNRSQRLAKNFFLTAAGIDSKDIRDQLVSDRSEFMQALDALNKAPISTAAIRNELSLVQSQWVFFEAALNRKADDESMRQVATSSERIHDVGDALTALYDAALKDLLGTTG